MVICLQRDADLHMAQLMPLTVSCFSKIQIDFTFLVLAHRVVPDKGPLNGCMLGLTPLTVTVTSEHICLYFFSISFPHFYCFISVQQIKLTYVGF